MNTLTLKRARECYWFAEYCAPEFSADYQAEADAMTILSLAIAADDLPAFKRWLAARNL